MYRPSHCIFRFTPATAMMSRLTRTIRVQLLYCQSYSVVPCAICIRRMSYRTKEPRNNAADPRLPPHLLRSSSEPDITQGGEWNQLNEIASFCRQGASSLSTSVLDELNRTRSPMHPSKTRASEPPISNISNQPNILWSHTTVPERVWPNTATSSRIGPAAASVLDVTNRTTAVEQELSRRLLLDPSLIQLTSSLTSAPCIDPLLLENIRRRASEEHARQEGMFRANTVLAQQAADAYRPSSMTLDQFRSRQQATDVVTRLATEQHRRLQQELHFTNVPTVPPHLPFHASNSNEVAFNANNTGTSAVLPEFLSRSMLNLHSTHLLPLQRPSHPNPTGTCSQSSSLPDNGLQRQQAAEKLIDDHFGSVVGSRNNEKSPPHHAKDDDKDDGKPRSKR